MRMIAVYHKGLPQREISHLDVQRTLQRALRRSHMPLMYSNGFNPHPLISFASALATGTTGDAEWFEVRMEGEITPEAFMNGMNCALPDGMFVSDARIAAEDMPTLSSMTRAALLRVWIDPDQTLTKARVEAAVADMLSGEIIVQKRTKGGIKPVDIRPLIIEVTVEEVMEGSIRLLILGKQQADGGLRAELFVRALLDRLDANGDCRVHRIAVYFDSDGLLPRLPL